MQVHVKVCIIILHSPCTVSQDLSDFNMHLFILLVVLYVFIYFLGSTYRILSITISNGEARSLGGSKGCLVKFVSWNVKSLNHPVNVDECSHILNISNWYWFLQQAHLHTADQSILGERWIVQAYHSSFGSRAKGGRALLISKNVPVGMSSTWSDSTGRHVIVVSQLYGFLIISANIYAPNSADNAFFINDFLTTAKQGYTSLHFRLETQTARFLQY